MNSTADEGSTVSSSNVLSALLVFVIGILSIIGNSFVLLVLKRNRKLLGTSRKFCIHLAVADFGNGLNISIRLIHNLLTFAVKGNLRNTNETYQDIFCVPITVVLILLSCASLAILTVNNIERYLAICRRPQYEHLMTRWRSSGLIVISWLFGVIVAGTSYAGLVRAELQRDCLYQNMFQNWIYLVHSSFMSSMTISNVVLFVFIIQKARSFYRRVSPAAMQGMTITAKRYREMRKSIRNGKIMGFVTMFFILCWTPLSACQIYLGLMDAASKNVLNVSVLTFMYTLALSNSAINPFIYAWQKREFRDSCKKYTRCKALNQVDAE